MVHAHGHHDYKPLWPPIRQAFFESVQRHIGAAPHLTVVTCNNGHEALGLLERSLDRLGVPYLVGGEGFSDWRNSRDKPKALSEVLHRVTTAYTLYADSRDAILVGDPGVLVNRFQAFGCELVFGADCMTWPPDPAFRRFEDSIAPSDTVFRYLNGGVWIGRTQFCREFFETAERTAPLASAPDSEQGILRRLLPRFYPRVRLDYHCEMFQNIGFVARPIIEILPGHDATSPEELQPTLYREPPAHQA